MASEKNSSISKIVFYAPIGNLIKGFKSGGAEAGCRKTIEVLTKAGYIVQVIEKPAKAHSSAAETIKLLINLFKLWIKLIGAFIADKKAVFHVAGFYLDQIYFEWFFTKTAKLFGVRAVYEIRNGGMIEAYRTKGKMYKWFMKNTLSSVDLILCQGFDYVTFLSSNFNLKSTYYPNYIMDSFLSDNNNGRENDETIKLIFVGRVVPDKNVSFIIDVCNELQKSGLNFVLNIIGGYEESYHKQLMAQQQGYNLSPDKILFHGNMNFNEIYVFLKQSHFFVFPSKEKREGHSNALTEAMGCGVVPVASNVGFNSSIVSRPELIVGEYNAKLYTSVISKIWRSGSWKTVSDECYARISNNFTESIVRTSLLHAYSSL